MTSCSPSTTCAKRSVHVVESIKRQMSTQACRLSRSPSSSCCSFFHSGKFWQRCATLTIWRTLSCLSIGSQIQGRCLMSRFFKTRISWLPFIMRISVSSKGHQMLSRGLRLLSRGRNMSLRLSVPSLERVSKFSWGAKRANWQRRSISAGVIFGLCASFASEPRNAEVSKRPETVDEEEDESSARSSHGKRVYSDYSIIGYGFIRQCGLSNVGLTVEVFWVHYYTALSGVSGYTGIPGDGRCMFRSVVHGACLRSGKPSLDESLQKELADELRSRVADEFVKRREETEWFVEGDFDKYVSRMRRPHVWGGEPELFMASHVLQMPITVYMHDMDSGGLIAIAEYGEEYGKENPIRVLYHGYGHYDVLQICGKKGAKLRL